MSSPIPPNDTDPPKIRLRKAKEWLIQNPTETQAVASRIFNIHKKTLNNSINRGQSNPHHGGQNKILSQSQEHAIHTFIQSYLNHGQTPTRYILFGIICQLQSRQGRTLLRRGSFQVSGKRKDSTRSKQNRLRENELQRKMRRR